MSGTYIRDFLAEPGDDLCFFEGSDGNTFAEYPGVCNKYETYIVKDDADLLASPGTVRANAKRATTTWITINYSPKDCTGTYECAKCGRSVLTLVRGSYPFCPWCGREVIFQQEDSE